MEHVSRLFKRERPGRVTPGDIEAGVLAAVDAILPEIPAGHRGVWRYDPRGRALSVRVTHGAIAVAIKLRVPEIRRALEAGFPGKVKAVRVRTGPAAVGLKDST